MSSPKSIKSEDMGSALREMDLGGIEETFEDYGNLDELQGLSSRDVKAIEKICSSDAKQVLGSLDLDLQSNAVRHACVVYSNPANLPPGKVFKEIALTCGNFQPLNVEKIGKGLYNVFFNTYEEAELAFSLSYINAKMVSLGRPISFFYRVTYLAEEVRKDHEDRILNAIKESTNLNPISVTINEKKGCATVYVPTRNEFGALLSAQKSVNIKVSAAGPFAPAYWLRVDRCTAHTNDPDIAKIKVSDIPSGVSEFALLKGIKLVLSEVIPEDNLLGLGIYNFRDSNKSSHFGFMFVVGEEASRILERVEIPVPSAKTPLSFQVAIDRPAPTPAPSPASSPAPSGAPRLVAGSSSSNRNSNGAHHANQPSKRKDRTWE